jgi:hypothetical protein
MYPCTVRAAQYRSSTQRSNAETRGTSQKKNQAPTFFTYLLVKQRLTTVGGVIVAVDDGTAGVLPVRDADAKEPAFAFLALEATVAVRVGLTQASQT